MDDNSNKINFNGFTPNFLKNKLVKMVLRILAPSLITVFLWLLVAVIIIYPLWAITKWLGNNFNLLGGKQNGIEITRLEQNRQNMTDYFQGLQGRFDTDEFREKQQIGLWGEWSQKTDLESMEGYNNKVDQMYQQYQKEMEEQPFDRSSKERIIRTALNALKPGQAPLTVGQRIKQWNPWEYGYSNLEREIIIELDYVMLMATLTQSRASGDLLFFDDIEEASPSSADPFYYTGKCTSEKGLCYKALHSEEFREKYEKLFYEKIRNGERIPAIITTEILSKYMIVLDYTSNMCVADADEDMTAQFLKIDEMVRYTVGIYKWNEIIVDGQTKYECMGIISNSPYDTEPTQEMYYEIECDTFKNYLYGQEEFEDYELSFIDNYYLQYLNNPEYEVIKKEKKQQLVDGIYKLALFFDDSPAGEPIVSQCAYSRKGLANPNEPCDCEAEKDEKNDMSGKGACEYENLQIRLTTCPGDTNTEELSKVVGGSVHLEEVNGKMRAVADNTISFREYIENVTAREISESAPMEALKMQIIAAKSYLVNNASRGDRAVVMGSEIYVPAFSNCFQSYGVDQPGRLPGPRIAQAYDEVNNVYLYEPGSSVVYYASYSNSHQEAWKAAANAGASYTDMLGVSGYDAEFGLCYGTGADYNANINTGAMNNVSKADFDTYMQQCMAVSGATTLRDKVLAAAYCMYKWEPAIPYVYAGSWKDPTSGMDCGHFIRAAFEYAMGMGGSVSWNGSHLRVPANTNGFTAAEIASVAVPGDLIVIDKDYVPGRTTGHVAMVWSVDPANGTFEVIHLGGSTITIHQYSGKTDYHYVYDMNSYYGGP